MDKNKKDDLPLTQAEQEAMGTVFPDLGEHSAEVIIDRDYISIPRSRYDELLRAEKERDIAINAVLEVPKYNLQTVLCPVLGLKECDLPHA